MNVKKTKSRREGGGKTAVIKSRTATAMPGAGNKSAKARKPAGGKKPKRFSALDAAAQVLKSASKPMRAQELIAAMADQGLWTSPGGKTPHATLYAAMMREERDGGNASRFKKVDRGLFEFHKAGA